MHPDARLDESREPQTLPHGENRWAYLIDASDLSLRHSFPICNCYTQSFATNFSSPEDGHCSLCAHLTSGTDNSCWISVDSEIQPSGQMHSANSQSLPSFVAKIHQIILRGRHLLVPPETTQELQHHQDEQQSLSHLDILFGRQILVERWVIGLEGVSASE